MKERGLRRGARRGNGSPLTGRKTIKLPCCPRATVNAQSNHIQSDSTNDVTIIQVTGNKNMTVMDTHRKNSAKVWYGILRIDDDQGSRRKIVMKDTEASRKKTHFLSLPENIRL
jgi:hypothetical protein